MSTELRWGAGTHVGCVRSVNQDAYLAGPNLFVVADGMGGHAAGEVASSLAVAHLAAAADHEPLSEADVVAAVVGADAEIKAVADVDEAKRGMGTTVAGVALVRTGAFDEVLVFNVGDSRAYRHRAGELVQVSQDHSVVGEMVRSGELTPEEARAHPSRNIVTRVLGVADAADVELGHRDATGAVVVDRWRFEAVEGDRYLVCSDGLTNELSEAEIAAVLTARAGDPQAAVGELLETALDRGARDNVSVVVVEVVGASSTPGTDADDTNPRLRLDGVGPVPLGPEDPAPSMGSPSGVDPATMITGVPSFPAS